MIMKKQILFYLLILTQFSYGQLTTSTAVGPAGLVNNVQQEPFSTMEMDHKVQTTWGIQD